MIQSEIQALSTSIASLTLEDKPNVPPSNFPTLLQDALSTFTQVSQQQQLLGGKIYSLSAPNNKIHQLYEQWEKDADAMCRKLSGCQRQVETLYPYIQSLEIAAISNALAQIFFLRLSLPPLIQEVTKLKELTKAPEYKNAHILCRTAIEECEEIAASLQKCEELFTKTYTSIKAQSDAAETRTKTWRQRRAMAGEPPVERQILELHRTTLELFRHRMGNIHPSCQLLIKIDEAIRVCPLIKKPPTPSPLHENPGDPSLKLICDYIESFKTITELPRELNFELLSEGFFAWFKTHFTYREIKDPIEQLKNVARGVTKVEADLQKDLLVATQTLPLFNKYRQAIIYLRRELHDVKKLLLNKSTTCEVHAGLYYADRLERALSELDAKVYTFDQLLSTESSAALHLSGQLHRFLAETQAPIRKISHLSGPLEELFLTIGKYPTTTNPSTQNITSDLQSTCKKVVSIQAKTLLGTGLPEDKVFDDIINMRSLDSLDHRPIDAKSVLVALPDPLIAYIERECIKRLFFTPRGTPNSPKLDIILLILEKFPAYKQLYAKSRLDNRIFSEIIALYQSRIQTGPLPPYFQTTADLFCQLVELAIPGQNEFLTIFTYSKACQLLHRCEEQKDILLQLADPFKKASNTLHAQAVQKLGQSKQKDTLPGFLITHLSLTDQLDCHPDQASLLFSLVTTALYAEGQAEEQDRKTATTALRTWLARQTAIPFAILNTKSLKYLFALFVFRFSLIKETLWPVEQALLQESLKSSLENANLELAYKPFFGAAVFERLLYLNATTLPIKAYRGDVGYESWYTGVEYYDKFLHDRDRDPKWITYIDALLAPYLQDRTSIEDAYLQAMEACRGEMVRLSSKPQ